MYTFGITAVITLSRSKSTRKFFACENVVYGRKTNVSSKVSILFAKRYSVVIEYLFDRN